MANQKLSEVFSDWSSGTFKPVYIFAGEEVYLAENALRRLEKSLNIDALNREIFYCPDVSVNEIANASRTVPFISEKRLIIVKEAQKLRQNDLVKLAEFLQNPSETSCIVLIWLEKIKKDALRTPLFAAVEKSGSVVELKAFYEREMSEWVRSEAAAMKKIIGTEAVDYLIQESGSSLMDLHNELEKLFLFIGDKKEIQLQDVENLSGHTKQANLFELGDAVESKDIRSSLEILKSLLEEGEAPTLILAAVHRKIRRLLTAKSLLEEMGVGQGEAGKKLQLRSFFDRDFFRILEKYSLRELERDIRLVLEADVELKSSSRPENAVLEELFLGLAGKGLS